MATLVQHATDDGSNVNRTEVPATFGATPTEGNVLIAFASHNRGNVGNGENLSIAGWTETGSQPSEAGPTGAIFYKVAGAAESSTVTAVKAGNATIMRLHIFEYDGLDATDVLHLAGAHLRAAAATNITTDAITTTEANVLLLAAVYLGSNRTHSNSWTNDFTRIAIDATNTRQETAAREVSATGTYSTNEAWTGGTADARAMIVAFNLSAAGVEGTASISQSSTVAVTASGDHSGAGVISQSQTVTGTAEGQHNGTGSITQSHTVAATGTKGTSGTASVSQAQSLTETATGAHNGTASLSPSHTIAATGTAEEESAGTAFIIQSHTISVSGTKSSSGTASLSQTHSVSATGGKNETGTASISVASALLCTGTKGGDGTAAFTGAHTLQVVGKKQGFGVAGITQTYTLEVTGTAQAPRNLTYTVHLALKWNAGVPEKKWDSSEPGSKWKVGDPAP